MVRIRSEPLVLNCKIELPACNDKKPVVEPTARLVVALIFANDINGVATFVNTVPIKPLPFTSNFLLGLVVPTPTFGIIKLMYY